MSKKHPKHHQAINISFPEKAAASEQEQFHMIQVRAYQLWEQAGKPAGDDSREVFWIAAERELGQPASAG